MVLLGDLVPGKLGIFVDVMIVFHSVAFVYWAVTAVTEIYSHPARDPNMKAH
ncbi:hypothetical protein PBRA_002646 [Plasmodiophora brassicae]|uniref:Uncharacterized protein n=1 Tax=Plasmodiophora brassicae TaxID=37360 RepID=A0A0G4J5P5_PLABS|nr:hypothetical protein PBRA_002646 [Plasmodiophora brassicae]